jgi:hypothetical protein
MIYLLRSARALQGEAPLALPFAVEVANYLNEHYPEISIEVWRNVSGPIDQVHWVARYESLADMESVRQRLEQDDAYQELVGGFQSIFVLDSAADSIYETVP